jgi:hypothetical protein
MVFVGAMFSAGVLRESHGKGRLVLLLDSTEELNLEGFESYMCYSRTTCGTKSTK